MLILKWYGILLLGFVDFIVVVFCMYLDCVYGFDLCWSFVLVLLIDVFGFVW